MIKTAIRKITVSEYHKMAAFGIIQPDEKIELINGKIIYKMSPVNLRHSSTVRRLLRLLNKQFNDEVTLDIQNPIVIKNHSEPEPDLVILKFSDDDYSMNKPTSDDVLIIIEVSDTTLKRDKTTKLELYASANILEYWVINLMDNCVEVFQNPKGKFYQKHLILTDNDILNLPFEKTLKVSDILK
jgi:Uma2 family endonuclease